MRRSLAGILFVVMASLPARLAGATERRVVVVNGDARLVDVIGRSLSPWGSEVVGVMAAPPGSDMQVAASSAREIARSAQAGAVLWIASGTESDSLFVYDVSSQQIVVRPIATRPPYDEPTAAAIALSVKTVLRTSTIAPMLERLAPPSPPEASPSAESAAKIEPSASAAPQDLFLEAALGGRVPGGGGGAVEPRAAVGASWWPTLRFGASVTVSGGSGVGVDSPVASGRFFDTAVALSGRVRLPASERFAMQGAAGLGVHLAVFAADLASTGSHVQESRVNPSLDVSVLFDAALSARVRLGALLGLSYQLLYPRYSAAGQVVFDPSPIDPSAGLRISFKLN